MTTTLPPVVPGRPARRLLSAGRPAAGLLAGSVVSVRTRVPSVALTFDDGPEPGGTDRVLSALADAGAGATFFVLLTRVRRYRSLLDDVLAAGHEVGLHGADHRALPDLPPHEVAGVVHGARAELEDASGREIRWYRPPYGRQTPRTWRAVRAAGLTPVLWGPTTWDWRDVAPAVRLAKAVEGARPGAVVLAHDGFAGAEDAAFDGPAPELDRGALIADVLKRYAELGLSTRSYGEVLATGSPVREYCFPG
jgi:peptidoglycan/xylan/chitin deacetylase (PgdA/CDA1 family)